MSRNVLCRLDEIDELGARGVIADLPEGQTKLVLIRRGEDVWAYVNKCPHFSIGLDYEPGRFNTYQGRVVMCAHHSALFRFEDGHCIDGPCKGAALKAVPVQVVDGCVCLQAS